MGGAESCASPAPPSAPQPPSEGRGLQPRSWLGLDAISASEPGFLAGSNFLIRTPGLPACPPVGSQPSLPSCETAPHRPPHRPLTRTGNHTCTSWRGDSGVTGVGLGAGEVLVGAHALTWETRGKARAPHPAPSRPFQVPAPPCLSRGGERIPDPRSTTPPRESPARSAHPLLAPRGRGEQMGSREAGPLPQPRAAPSGGWSPAREGEPRPCEGRLRAPQTHVVGLKKLLGSEALAGVRRPSHQGRREGRCRGGELSTSRSLPGAPLTPTPEDSGDPHSAGE